MQGRILKDNMKGHISKDKSRGKISKEQLGTKGLMNRF
jgi:hypothetical protein